MRVAWRSSPPPAARDAYF